MLVVVATGYWDSPLAFSLLTAVAVAGFARGFGFGLRIAAVSLVAVTLPWALEPDFVEDDLRTSVQWAVEVLLVALVAGYARRISGEADQRQILALDRLGRLADANALLFQLHQVTQTLPGSLDLDEVLDATIEQLRELFEFDAVAILVFDDTDQRWHTLRREGTRPPSAIAQDDLPRPLARALRLRSLVSEQNLLAGGGPGLSPSSASGLYAVLPARGSIIGLVSIEHGDAHHFTGRDVELLAGFVEPAALAIDNARWFGRLRTVGADEERTRIARDLHDRIGQSLAYLAFELDRIVKSGAGGGDTTAALDNLRTDVRGVIGEVRDTLYDLRTDVTESQSLVDHARGVPRAGAGPQRPGRAPAGRRRPAGSRSSRSASCGASPRRRSPTSSATPRPPRSRSRGAATARDARLEVADDGIGFPVGQGRAGSTPTASSACGSGPPASAPPSSSTPSRAGARGYAARSTPGEPDSPSRAGWRWQVDDPAAAGRRPPHAPRGAPPVAHRGGLRRRRRGRERRAGRPPRRRAPARRRADGRLDARARRRRGHPGDPAGSRTRRR